jgi:hypothetical protein
MVGQGHGWRGGRAPVAMKATPRAYEGPAVYRGRATATSFHSHGNFENVSVEKEEILHGERRKRAKEWLYRHYRPGVTQTDYLRSIRVRSATARQEGGLV